MRKFTLFLVMFILFSISGYAIDSYNVTGANQYQGEIGIFDSDMLAKTTPIELSAIRNHAMVADLDGNGISEVIVIDDDVVRIFNYTDERGFVSIGATFDYGSSGQKVSNMQIFDIDGDNISDIIFAREGDEKIEILTYNGTNTIQNRTLSFSHLDHVNGDVMIHCGAVNNCLMVFSKEEDNTGANAELSAAAFNDTQIVSEILLDTDAGGAANYCFPKIRSIAYGNLDGLTQPDITAVDGNEYVFTAELFQGGVTNEELQLWALWISNNMTVRESTVSPNQKYTTLTHNFVTRQLDPYDTAGTADCNSAWSQGADSYMLEDLYTSPLMDDFDGADGRLEVVVGNAIFIVTRDGVSNMVFVMTSFDYQLTIDDVYPTFFTADGNIISNPFKVDLYEAGEANVDFCMLGQNRGQIDALCASYQAGLIPETTEFLSNTAEYNVTVAHRNYEVLTHAVEMEPTKIELEDSLLGNSRQNTHEILTNFGVYQFDATSFNGSTFNGFPRTLKRLYVPTIDHLACIPVDFQRNGFDDLICNSPDTLYYLDDVAVNAGAAVSNIEFSPCPLTDTILTNATMEIIVTVEDQNTIPIQDDVSARVTPFLGTSNEFSVTKGNTTSGQPFIFNIKINKSGSYTLQIEGWDKVNPNDIDICDDCLQNFIVSDSIGSEFGDSRCEIDVITPLEEPTTPAGISGIIVDAEGNLLVNNTLNRGIVALGNEWGAPAKLIWIIIMIILGLSVFLGKSFAPGGRDIPMPLLAGVMFFLEGAMVVVAVMLGIFGLGLILTFAFLILASVGIWFASRISGDTITHR